MIQQHHICEQLGVNNYGKSEREKSMRNMEIIEMPNFSYINNVRVFRHMIKQDLQKHLLWSECWQIIAHCRFTFCCFKQDMQCNKFLNTHG